MAVFALLAACVGIAICLQGATNGAFGQRLGIAAAVVVNLTVALVGALLAWWLSPRPPQAGGPLPWWIWLGGVYGLAILAGAAFVFPRLGAGAATAVVVAAQLATALCLDHFGWPGERVPVTPMRLAGVVLLVVGAVLVLWPRLRG